MPLRTIAFIGAVAVLCGGVVAAHSSRDDPKSGTDHDVAASLIYSLAMRL
jgi:hypothetical protein